ncbi:MAG TPA: tRNA (N(6)-L-threonylcarbamoyladenosine(37)-C(2))-methylthiotransferase MtaB, partial [Bacteroidales bacterium]|nr:tRNA (N(6)-L-threonylcarbamoyladenosine(37)-C(2))-methylthiotransferase MtaB [Bacteroidales bacterium]
MNNQVKIAFYTLGCKLNFTETSYLANSFNSDNFTIVPFSSVADIYIVNTCSVTSSANSKSRNAIRRAHHLNPEAIIAVTGCYAQLKPDEIMEIPGVQILAGSNQKLMIQKLIGQLSEKNKTHTYVEPSAGFCSFEPAYSFGDRTRSFVKVQDGCDYKCSYCTIPLARGGSRNQSV